MVHRIHTTAAPLRAVALASCAPAPGHDAPWGAPEGEWGLVTSGLVEIGRLPGLARPTLDVKNGRIAAFSGCSSPATTTRAVAGASRSPTHGA